ncbi:helix-turn-helix domain-containing protein [Infirmifilum lucidum]|nr:MarR family transcriptional regulator [Infirmifilum lucidum]
MESIDKKLIFTESDLILLALLSGEKKITELRPATGLSTTSIYNNVKKLIEYGLVEEDRKGSPGNRILRLTEKGQRVASILKMLEEELKPKVVVLKPE